MSIGEQSVETLLDLQALGRAIKEERKSRGFTQKEVIARISTFYGEERSYRRIENGEQRPSREALIAIVEKGLHIKDPDRAAQILALGGYVPLTAMEPARNDAVHLEGCIPPSFPVAPPSTPAPPIASPEHRLNLNFRAKLSPAVGAGSLVVGCTMAALSQDSVHMIATAILYGCLFVVSILLVLNCIS